MERHVHNPALIVGGARGAYQYENNCQLKCRSVTLSRLRNDVEGKD